MDKSTPMPRANAHWPADGNWTSGQNDGRRSDPYQTKAFAKTCAGPSVVLEEKGKGAHRPTRREILIVDPRDQSLHVSRLSASRTGLAPIPELLPRSTSTFIFWSCFTALIC